MTPDPRDPMVKALEAIAERVPGSLGDHPVARKLQAEVNRLRIAAEALDRVNANRSPLDTPAAHALKVAKRARAFGAEITATLNRAARIWNEGELDAQRRIDEKVNLKEDGFASEIRASFRALKPKAQAALITKLINENRGPELAAIVRAPAVLTNTTDHERAAYETAIYARHASGELDEIAGLRDAWDAVTVATRAAGQLEKQLTDPQKLAEIERGASAADDASSAFDQALSGE